MTTRERRRWFLVAAVVLVVCIGTASVVFASPGVTGLQTAGFAAALLASTLLALNTFNGLVQWARPTLDRPPGAEDLAAALAYLAHRKADENDREWDARNADDPYVLPVRWEAVDGRLADSDARVLGTRDSIRREVLRARLATGVVSDLSETISVLPRRRLVVLGGSGSGKSVLALHVTRRLLAERGAGDPVAVLLPLARWTPTTTDLETWIERELCRDERLANAADGRTLARALLDARAVLPVLDGLDELSQSEREAAIRRVNREFGQRPLVLTSREDGFTEAVLDPDGWGRDAVVAALVVRLLPLPADAAIDYLQAIELEDRQWESATAFLSSEPNSELANALSSPLMLALVRDAYRSHMLSPAQLLDQSSRGDIETVILGQVLPSTFSERPPSGNQKISPRRAATHLSFLARVAHSSTSRQDIEWWEFHRQVPRGLLEIIFSVPLGLFAGILIARYGTVASPVLAAPPVGCALGASFTYGYTVLRRSTGQLGGARGAFRGLCEGPQLARRGLRCIVFTLPALGISAVIAYLVAGSTVLNIYASAGLAVGAPLGGAIPAGALLGGAAGALLGRSQATDGIVATATAFDPRITLRRDRRATLLLAIILGSACAVILAAASGLGGGYSFAGLTSGFTFGFLLGGPAAVMLFTAWAPWIFVRSWLTLTGRMPLRFFVFLEVCYRGRILRKFGAVYQFRHGVLLSHFSCSG